MKVYQHDNDMAQPSRARNWVAAGSNPGFRYYDFRLHPELIPQVLEDFREFAPRAAIQEFYVMVADLNNNRSTLETNDSAFNAPAPNDSPDASAKRLVVSGRLMLLMRNLVLNARRRNLERLQERIQRCLSERTPELQEGVVGTSIMRMHLPELGSDSAPVQAFQLALHFWAWGDSEDEAFENLAVVFHNMHECLKSLSTFHR